MKIELKKNSKRSSLESDQVMVFDKGIRIAAELLKSFNGKKYAQIFYDAEVSRITFCPTDDKNTGFAIEFSNNGNGYIHTIRARKFTKGLYVAATDENGEILAELPGPIEIKQNG